ncbi:MAG: RNA polymerase sigma factor, partial [Polyangiaceae bacterium]|nr:RNA polymerase sigma factor [Polyangiaceae bacterium]
ADFVWRNVRRLGVPDGAADDVVQSVFLVVFRRLDDFEGRSSYKTWIYEIVLRVVREYRRTMKRKSPHAAGGDPVDPATLTAPAEQRPDTLADRAQAARIVQELLDGLDDEKREVFVFAELEGLTLHEIVEILHEPPGTIATRLRAARAEFERAAARRRARDQRRLRWTG